MAYPVSRKLTRRSGSFGPRKPIRLPDGTLTPGWHGGVDFTPLASGTRLPVYAVGAGVVVIADRTTSASDFSGMDIGIRLADRSIWWYGHLSRVDVNVGQRVIDGQQIGLMGATGRVTGVHLHLERHWPSLNVETDPWPYIKDERDIDGNTSSWQTGNPPAAVGDTGNTEEEELMGAKEDIIAAIEAQTEMLSSRQRREARPEVYYIATGDDGRQYTLDDSPAAALIHPASGFIMPLDAADDAGRGQVASLKRNYRIIAEDSRPEGFHESVFWNTLKDVARGAGIIDREIDAADGVAWARSLFSRTNG